VRYYHNDQVDDRDDDDDVMLKGVAREDHVDESLLVTVDVQS